MHTSLMFSCVPGRTYVMSSVSPVFEEVRFSFCEALNLSHNSLESSVEILHTFMRRLLAT